MEHAISGTVAERLIRFVQFIERCPRWGETWVERFRKCEDDPPDVDQCRACIQSCLESAGTTAVNHALPRTPVSPGLRDVPHE
jgi:DtxR family Mn-dependent transcriptional regulator